MVQPGTSDAAAGHLRARHWATILHALASTIIEAPTQFIRQQGYMYMYE